MPTTRSATLAVSFVIAALALAGCGASTGSGTTSTGPATASDEPSDPATTGALVVTRTGGIAGVADQVRIAADGTASIMSKAGKSGLCRPSATSLDRLRAIDLAAVGAASKPPRMADGFNYSVKSGHATGSASEGDDDSRRAELVNAAAAIVATCLARQY